jgi:Mg2+ and Co2+ transporter CorA
MPTPPSQDDSREAAGMRHRTGRSAAGTGGRLIFATLRLPGVLLPEATARRRTPGASPGIEQRTDIDRRLDPNAATVRCIDDDPDRLNERDVELDALDDLLSEGRPDGVNVRWINGDGPNVDAVQQFMQQLNLHTLAAEDMLNTPQRPKLEICNDPVVQVVDIIETCREMATGLSGLCMSAVGNRMNEAIKTLTIMASLFIPLSWLAGIFGMNFQHMPELEQSWRYPWGFWSLCVAIMVSLPGYFRWNRWL